MSISKALEDKKIDERDFAMLQTLHLEALSDLSNIDKKMAAEARSQFDESLLEEINDLKKELRKRDASLCVLSFLCVISLATKMDKLQSIYYQQSHLWKGQKAVNKL